MSRRPGFTRENYLATTGDLWLNSHVPSQCRPPREGGSSEFQDGCPNASLRIYAEARAVMLGMQALQQGRDEVQAYYGCDTCPYKVPAPE